MLKYNQFNESLKQYPYRKIYVKVWSSNDISKVYDIYDEITKQHAQRNLTLCDYEYKFPNYMSVPTRLNTSDYCNMLSGGPIDDYYYDSFISTSPEFDPKYLEMNQLSYLKNIILNGIKPSSVKMYNEPKKLVYESVKEKYKYDYVFVKVDSLEDVNKVDSYIDNLVEYYVEHKNPFNINDFPNYVVVPTDLRMLSQSGTNKFTSNPSRYDDIKIKEYLLRYPSSYDPNVIKINELSQLKKILFEGKRVRIIDYNEPKKLVYENKNKHF